MYLNLLLAANLSAQRMPNEYVIVAFNHAGQVHAEQKTSDRRVVPLFSLLAECMTRCFARVCFRHCHVTLQPYFVEVDSEKKGE